MSLFTLSLPFLSSLASLTMCVSSSLCLLSLPFSSSSVPFFPQYLSLSLSLSALVFPPPTGWSDRVRSRDRRSPEPGHVVLRGQALPGRPREHQGERRGPGARVASPRGSRSFLRHQSESSLHQSESNLKNKFGPRTWLQTTWESVVYF